MEKGGRRAWSFSTGFQVTNKASSSSALSLPPSPAGINSKQVIAITVLFKLGRGVGKLRLWGGSVKVNLGVPRCARLSGRGGEIGILNNQYRPKPQTSHQSCCLAAHPTQLRMSCGPRGDPRQPLEQPKGPRLNASQAPHFSRNAYRQSATSR